MEIILVLFPSWLLLAGANVMHSVGLKPSYADLGWGLKLARTLLGLLFLPRLVYSLFYGKRFDRIFLLFFCRSSMWLPQESYCCPSHPFWYGGVHKLGAA